MDSIKNTALVVMDIQNDITKNYKDVVANVNKAIEWAVNSGVYVVYVKHHNLSEGARTFKPDTRGADFAAELNVVSENVFIKTKSNALTSEGFTRFISEKRITEFYVVGADATACVKSTCYNMAKTGYAVHVLADCITSYDKTKIGEMLRCYESKGCSVERLNELV